MFTQFPTENRVYYNFCSKLFIFVVNPKTRAQSGLRSTMTKNFTVKNNSKNDLQTRIVKPFSSTCSGLLQFTTNFCSKLKPAPSLAKQLINSPQELNLLQKFLGTFQRNHAILSTSYYSYYSFFTPLYKKHHLTIIHHKVCKIKNNYYPRAHIGIVKSVVTVVN